MDETKIDNKAKSLTFAVTYLDKNCFSLVFMKATFLPERLYMFLGYCKRNKLAGQQHTMGGQNKQKNGLLVYFPAIV